MRLNYLMDFQSRFLAAAVLLLAAHNAGAGTVSRPFLPVHGAAWLTFLPLPLDSMAGEVPPIRSTCFSDSLQGHGERFPAPAPVPPVLVRNPFFPATRKGIAQK
jgi:hypothetical protein